jgi:[ribosomal protein S18]-alanine N-acetyltransferase
VSVRAAVEVRIEPARAEHAARIAQLHARLFDVAWSKSTIQQMLEDTHTIAFVAQAPAGAPIGFVIGRTVADEAELLSIGVDPAWQRRGIGRLLAEALCAASVGAQAHRLYLEVAAGNLPALRLYTALGGRNIGLRKGYYERPEKPAEDAVNLVIPLSDREVR